jgi:hypothetical protein
MKRRSKAMSKKPCRDCGYLLDASARGCPRCALNVDAERMIERFIWRRLVPGVLVIAAIVTFGIIWWLR